MVFQERLIVNTESRNVSVISPVRLNEKEYNLLVYLINHVGTIVTAEQIIDELWSDEHVNSLFVQNVIHNLRYKIELTPRRPTMIQTIRNEGYMFCPEGSTKI